MFPVLVQIFERRQTEPLSTSPYAASTASHTCRILALYLLGEFPFAFLALEQTEEPHQPAA